MKIGDRWQSPKDVANKAELDAAGVYVLSEGRDVERNTTEKWKETGEPDRDCYGIRCSI